MLSLYGLESQLHHFRAIFSHLGRCYVFLSKRYGLRFWDDGSRGRDGALGTLTWAHLLNQVPADRRSSADPAAGATADQFVIVARCQSETRPDYADVVRRQRLPRPDVAHGIN
jgi:hypothetical protein